MEIQEKTIEEAAKIAQSYLDDIVKAPLAEFGLLLRDRISYWRFKNQVNTIIKAKQFLEKKNVNAREISLKAMPEFIVPLLESASETEDETLQDMFATLLATSLSADKIDELHPVYTKILNQLSPLDAQILHHFYAHVKKTLNKKPPLKTTKVNSYRDLDYATNSVVTLLNISEKAATLSFENIRRLGICDRGGTPGNLNELNKLPVISFTELGWSFMVLCSGEYIPSK